MNVIILLAFLEYNYDLKYSIIFGLQQCGFSSSFAEVKGKLRHYFAKKEAMKDYLLISLNQQWHSTVTMPLCENNGLKGYVKKITLKYIALTKTRRVIALNMSAETKFWMRSLVLLSTWNQKDSCHTHTLVAMSQTKMYMRNRIFTQAFITSAALTLSAKLISLASALKISTESFLKASLSG